MSNLLNLLIFSEQLELHETIRKLIWCPGPESNRYAPFTEATDFKSVVSTYFTTRAQVWFQAGQEGTGTEQTTKGGLEAGAGIEPT